METEKSKLSREDWIKAAGIFLANKDISSLKVEVLAKELKLSKGSFYWHFRDRADLLVAILSYWQEITDWLISEASKENDAKKRLIKLFSLIDSVGAANSPEQAILLWTRQNKEVAEVVKDVEAKRIQFLTKIFLDYGFKADIAKARAETSYLAFLGYLSRAHRDINYSQDFPRFSQELVELLFTEKG